jgi:hypothetical protein
VDNKPIMLLYGNVPAYRDLKIGVEGKDVENPERNLSNLSKLGYDGFTVDEEFTYDTCCRRPADLGGDRRAPNSSRGLPRRRHPGEDADRCRRGSGLVTGDDELRFGGRRADGRDGNNCQ